MRYVHELRSRRKNHGRNYSGIRTLGGNARAGFYRAEYSEGLLSEVEQIGKERKVQGKRFWLRAPDDPDESLNDLLEVLASRCFVHDKEAVDC